MVETIELLIEGGKATPGPPLGPTLAPLKINVGKLVADINEKTKSFSGMKVPVKVMVDTVTKEYEIEVGLPPTSQLIKKEVGLEKGSQKAGTEIAGDISLDKLVGIVKVKEDTMLGKTMKDNVKQIVGTCLSIGVTVNGKDPREVIKEIDEGKQDNILK